MHQHAGSVSGPVPWRLWHNAAQRCTQRIERTRTLTPSPSFGTWESPGFVPPAPASSLRLAVLRRSRSALAAAEPNTRLDLPTPESPTTQHLKEKWHLGAGTRSRTCGDAWLRCENWLRVVRPSNRRERAAWRPCDGAAFANAAASSAGTTGGVVRGGRRLLRSVFASVPTWRALRPPLVGDAPRLLAWYPLVRDA